MAVKASSLIKSKRQGSETRPVFGIAGVSTWENVAPRLLVQKLQHGLIVDLLRSETMTAIINLDDQKSSLKPTQHLPVYLMENNVLIIISNINVCSYSYLQLFRFRIKHVPTELEVRFIWGKSRRQWCIRIQFIQSSLGENSVVDSALTHGAELWNFIDSTKKHINF